jgi:hypothetical protein
MSDACAAASAKKSQSVTIITDRDRVLHYHDTSTRASLLLAQRLVTPATMYSAYRMLVRDCLPECIYADDVAEAVRRALRARLQPRIKQVRRARRIA